MLAIVFLFLSLRAWSGDSPLRGTTQTPMYRLGYRPLSTSNAIYHPTMCMSLSYCFSCPPITALLNKNRDTVRSIYLCLQLYFFFSQKKIGKTRSFVYYVGAFQLATQVDATVILFFVFLTELLIIKIHCRRFLKRHLDDARDQLFDARRSTSTLAHDSSLVDSKSG